jgi:hypothetical protein
MQMARLHDYADSIWDIVAVLFIFAFFSLCADRMIASLILFAVAAGVGMCIYIPAIAPSPMATYCSGCQYQYWNHRPDFCGSKCLMRG